MGLWWPRVTKRQHPPLPYPITRPYSGAPGKRRRQPIPDKIARLYLPLSVLEATDRIMRRFGKENRECYVWWGGYFTPDGRGQILTALCPDMRTTHGRIHLDNHDLTELHMRLRALDQVLLVELHTHPPGAGGQNEVDAAHPASTHHGFISIVVPDFASPHLYDLRKVWVYEYVGLGRWRHLSPPQIQERFVIEEPSVTVKI